MHLGPVDLRPCVGQHAWGFGCLFLASFLLLINKQELNEEEKKNREMSLQIEINIVNLLFKVGRK